MNVLSYFLSPVEMWRAVIEWHWWMPDVQLGSNHHNTEHNNQRTVDYNEPGDECGCSTGMGHSAITCPEQGLVTEGRVSPTATWWPPHKVTKQVQLDKPGSEPGLPVRPNPKQGSCCPGNGAWRWSQICPRAIQDCWCPHSSDIDWRTHLCCIFEVILIEAYIIISVM